MKDFKRLIIRFVLAVGIPALLLVGIYVAVDPFKAVWDYDDYFAEDAAGNVRAGINKGMISFANFNKYNPSRRFDSFILGSSVSITYRADEWKKYLPEDARPFHFDSSAESIHSMLLKLRYIESCGNDIRNALIVMSVKEFELYDRLKPPYVNPWQIDPDVSFVDYHWMYITSFYNREFLRSYAAAKLFNRETDVSYIKSIDKESIRVIPEINEEISWQYDLDIVSDPKRYASEHYADLDRHDPEENPPYASAEAMADLREIADILRRHATDYRVVIGPRRNKSYTNHADVDSLRSVFGPGRVFDLSKDMAYVADNDTAYYDEIHYRQWVSADILSRLYSPSNKSAGSGD